MPSPRRRRASAMRSSRGTARSSEERSAIGVSCVAGRSPRAGAKSIRKALDAESPCGGTRRDPRASPRRRRASAPGTADGGRVAPRAAKQRGVRALHGRSPGAGQRRDAGRVVPRRARPGRDELDDDARARERHALSRGGSGRAGGEALPGSRRRALGLVGLGLGCRDERDRAGGRPALVHLRVPPRPGRRPRLLPARAPRAGRGRGQGRVARAGEGTPGARRVGLRGLFRLGPGADRVELAVDAERGALLRSEAFLGDEPFHRLEVDGDHLRPEPLGDFDLTLPEGVVASGGWPRPQRLPLHELAAAAPFAVFVPERVPEGWRLFERLFTAGRERPPVEPEVFLGYMSREGAYEVSVRQRSSSSTRAEWLDWQPGDERAGGRRRRRERRAAPPRARRAWRHARRALRRRPDAPHRAGTLARPCARGGAAPPVGRENESRGATTPRGTPTARRSSSRRPCASAGGASARSGSRSPAPVLTAMPGTMNGFVVTFRLPTAFIRPARVRFFPAFFRASTSVKPTAIPYTWYASFGFAPGA